MSFIKGYQDKGRMVGKSHSPVFKQISMRQKVKLKCGQMTRSWTL